MMLCMRVFIIWVMICSLARVVQIQNIINLQMKRDNIVCVLCDQTKKNFSILLFFFCVYLN